MEVTFDPVNHAYMVDGRQVPSVTQLVAPLGKDYDEDDEDFGITVEAAAERGTVMHAYIAHRLQGGTRDEWEMPAEYEDFADSVDLFLSEHSIVPLLIETPLGTDTYAGTPDLVADFDGETALLDYKFVSQIAKSKVGAQLNGYNLLLIDNGIYVDKLFAVQFMRGGEYRIYPADMTGDAFACCCELWRQKNKKHPRGRIS